MMYVGSFPHRQALFSNMIVNACMYIIHLTSTLVLYLIYFQVFNIINNTASNILHKSLHAHVLLFPEGKFP